LNLEQLEDSTPRDVAVFIDGTWNSGESRSPTNVRKLYDATLTGLHAGRLQAKLYIPGVGTRPRAEGVGLLDDLYEAHLAAHLNREFGVGGDVLRGTGGGLFGKGTKARIKAAYHTICDNFDKERGDRVFIFGFSRGAFAARSLSGFIEKVGLLFRDMVYEVDRAYELYESAKDARQDELKKYMYDLKKVGFANSESNFYLPLHFLGVWDTVGSLGLPGRAKRLSAPFTEYHQAGVPSNITRARHALALHELRASFEPLLWHSNSHPSLKQVWFAGAHADVGGGYPVPESGLSNLALKWMADEVDLAGLRLDLQSPWLTDTGGLRDVHHQIRGLFLASSPTLRNWLAKQNFDPTDGCYFHESVRDRLVQSNRQSYWSWLPCVRAALRKVDEATVPMLIQSRLYGKEFIK
jgi:uncharacterized protein (DUF2235 family)